MTSVDTETAPWVSIKPFGAEAIPWRSSLSGLGFRCEIRLIPEQSGFSVYVAELEGVCSQGENEEEAMLNIMDALKASISLYLESGEEIPWSNPDPPEQNEISKWVVVDA